MKTFAPSKTRQTLFAACAVGFSLVASGGLAEDVVVEGGTMVWDGDELVITYSDPTTGGTLTLPKTASARILAVGGGGGGGRVTKVSTSQIGGGGGGGGGGVVVVDNVALRGTYSISVGAGGAAGEGGTDVSNPGSSGGDTSFMQDGSAVIDVAKGGGGGGAQSVGLPGGCGGGGSMSAGKISKAGGEGLDSQGYAGGSSLNATAGAGGGGAGSKGNDTKDKVSGANGGDGIESDITGKSVFYGGGGGGGNSNYSMTGKSDGGKGGGGKGLGGNTADKVSADEIARVNGTDGLGGGGGGGGAYDSAVAGKGGSGVLIVRITAYLDSGVTPPTVYTDLVYNGEKQYAFDPNDPNRAFYTVTAGSDTATNAGEHSFTLTLNDGLEWSDETIAPKTYTWSIAQKPVPLPTFTTSFVYETGEVRVALEESDDYARTGTPEATNAGNYECAAVLKNTTDTVNYVWADGTTGPVSADWTIAKAANAIGGLSIEDWQAGAIAASPSVSSLVYGSVGDIVYAYREASATDWVTAKPSAAGRYVVRATLAASTNWEGATATAEFRVWQHPSAEYTDYIDITNSASSGAVDVTVSESGLPGFLYDRTDGLKNNAFRFVYSPTTDSLHDLLLPYSNLTWNVSGESTMRVRLPSGGMTASPIRMYWHAGVDDPTSANDAGAASLAAADAATGYGLVNSNGVWINYWTVEPSITKTSWDEGETAGVITAGELKVGAVKVTYQKLPSGAD